MVAPVAAVLVLVLTITEVRTSDGPPLTPGPGAALHVHRFFQHFERGISSGARNSSVLINVFRYEN